MLAAGTESEFLQLLTVFGAGLLSSMTPCVYPLIPITLSLFGVNSEIKRSRAFLLALSYVFGIAITYSTLGVVTALTGAVFGSFLGSPLVVWPLFGFLIILSLFCLDVVSINLSRLQSKAQRVGGKGLLGSFLMGLVSGVVAAPCVGPVLTVVLVQAASSESAAWGGVLLFCYAMGFGSVFLVLGTYSNLITKLPRSGDWLSIVKHVISIAVIVTAFSFLGALYTDSLRYIASFLPSFVLIAAMLVAFLLAKSCISLGKKRQQWCMAFVSSVAIFFLFFVPQIELQDWFQDPSQALLKARESNKIVMVDLYADWCAACKELEHTFSDLKARTIISDKLVAARVDFTRETDETEELSEKYQVVGLPCVLFLDGEGREIPNSRITGFLDADKFVQHLQEIVVSEL